MLSTEDIEALVLTAKLASVSTGILLVIATPIAWWLANSRSKARALVNAVVALPLILPPTVLGFYLLLAMGPSGPIGFITNSVNVSALPFTFAGLVLGSVIYSMPFVVQPIQNAFLALGKWPIETAATLGASPWQCFTRVILPMSRPGFLTAAVLGFAHTVGEFGVVLMIGGNIPGVTKVASVQIYEHVETLQYAQAHGMSLLMVVFALLVLLVVYAANGASRNFIVVNRSQ